MNGRLAFPLTASKLDSEAGNRGFRHDINGLRAIAVLAVVLFHYKVPFFDGGFVGVDVFFVISGFLMTKIIVERIDRGEFRLTAFIRARAQRIIPALAAMIIVLICFGFVCLDPLSLLDLGKEALSAVTFVSNILFWRDAGYFDIRAEQKWLLHTWSLSVEWQFYLIFPIVMLALSRFPALWRKRTVLFYMLTAGSLALSAALSLTYASASFYLLPTRAWEMTAGSIVFFSADRRHQSVGLRRLLALAGLLAIAASILMFDAASPWPSYRAVLPVFGACLVIAANDSAALWAKNPIVRTIGRWSYSIYIWHWPLIVGLRTFSYDVSPLNTIFALAVVFAIAIALANQLRKTAWAAIPSQHPYTLAGVGLVAALLVVATNGSENRRPGLRDHVRDAQEAISDSSFPAVCGGFVGGRLHICTLGAGPGPHTLVIGDSHAELLYDRYAKNPHLLQANTLTFATFRGCPLAFGMNRVAPGYRCNDFLEEAFRMAESGSFSRVVVLGMWSAYDDPTPEDLARPEACFIRDGRCVRPATVGEYQVDIAREVADFAGRLKRIHEAGKDVIVVGPFPYHKDDLPRALVRRMFDGRDTTDLLAIDRAAFETKMAPALARLRSAAQTAGAEFFDAIPDLCGADTCPTVGADGLLYYRDSNHIRASTMQSSRFQFLDHLVVQTMAY